MELRNVAIIAHVDHGKTTLVDQLLKQGGSFRENEEVDERVMDSDNLERERGITILSKNAAIQYGETRINIVDTPGHADFGGQVERVLGTVDGVLLIVDAFEGPMAQTRFVTSKALALGLKVIVVINKIDRDGCDPEKAHDMVFDLFCELDADEDQLEFPYIYASGRAGTCRLEMDQEDGDLIPLLDMIVAEIPSHKGDATANPVMQISSLFYSEFLGRLAVGRLLEGTLKTSQTVQQSTITGKPNRFRIQKLLHYEGIINTPIDEAVAGDIISIAGIPHFDIGDTISLPEAPVELDRPEVDPPTICMSFTVNDSPLAGQSGGKFLTGNHLNERLERAALADPALVVEKGEGSGFLVSGRGVLHLTILIENMRREAYEFTIGAPQVLFKEIDGKVHEPFEKLIVNVPQEFSGAVIEELGKKKSEMVNMEHEGSEVKIEFRLPSRALIGLRTILLSLTKGYAVMQTIFAGYEQHVGEIPSRVRGALICNKEAGLAMAYALFKLQDRGSFFISPTTEVYEGMIIGECNRNEDIVINCTKGKQLTNVRSSGADDAINLAPPRQMSLEDCVTFINRDECVEVTPDGLRLRKLVLSENLRKSSARKEKGG